VSVYYLDTSAIAKRYIFETGTSWIFQLFDAVPSHILFASKITHVEVVSAIARRRRERSIPSGVFEGGLIRFQDDLRNRFSVISIDDSVIESAALLARLHALRSYDAVQLASALSVQRERRKYYLPSITFVSADEELNKIAQIEGLPVDNPNDHGD
jgi:hypothetical protein